MKKKWLSIIILFLLAANLTLVITLLVRHSQTSTNNYDDTRNFRNAFTRHTEDFESYISEKLQLDEKQRGDLQNLSSDFHNQKILMREKMGLIKGKYLELLSSEKADTLLLNQLADSLGTIHATMIKLDFQHYNNIRFICTKEQVKTLDSLGRIHMSDIRENDCRHERRFKHHSGNNHRN